MDPISSSYIDQVGAAYFSAFIVCFFFIILFKVLIEPEYQASEIKQKAQAILTLLDEIISISPNSSLINYFEQYVNTFNKTTIDIEKLNMLNDRIMIELAQGDQDMLRLVYVPLILRNSLKELVLETKFSEV